MADRSYGGRRDGARERGGSIFTEDEPRDRSRGGRDDERGFFDRAGDEVRSWFGDEEAERRRERDLRRDEARSAYAERDPGRGDRNFGTPYGGFGRSEVGGRSGYDRSSRDVGDHRGGFRGYGDREHGGRSGFLGQSHWDDNYRRWRDQQIERFDREYEEYRREHQQKFDRDFDSWRNSRLTEGGAPGAEKPGPAGGRSGTSGSKRSAAAAAGEGNASATRASTGSSPSAKAEASADGEAGGATRARGGRSRG